MANSVNINLDVLFNKLESFASSKTVVGEPITFGDIVLLPLVEVSVGVGAYGSDSTKDAKETGTGGLGAKIIPSAILVINGGNVQLVNIKNQDSLNKIIDMAPGLLNRFNLGNIFNKNKSENDTTDNIKGDIKKEESEYNVTDVTKDSSRPKINLDELEEDENDDIVII